MSAFLISAVPFPATLPLPTSWHFGPYHPTETVLINSLKKKKNFVLPNPEGYWGVFIVASKNTCSDHRLVLGTPCWLQWGQLFCSCLSGWPFALSPLDSPSWLFPTVLPLALVSLHSAFPSLDSFSHAWGFRHLPELSQQLKTHISNFTPNATCPDLGPSVSTPPPRTALSCFPDLGSYIQDTTLYIGHKSEMNRQ